MTFQSERNGCGLACLAMVLAHHGRVMDLAELREACQPGDHGVQLADLISYAARQGFDSRAVRLRPEQVNQLQLPAILHWDLDHFVVVTKCSKKSVTIHDPAAGVRCYSTQELGHHFTGVALEFRKNMDFIACKRSRNLSMRDMARQVPGFWAGLATVLVLTLMVQGLALASPLFVQLVIDRGLSGGNLEFVGSLALIFLGLTVARYLVVFQRGVLALSLSNSIGLQMTGSAFAKLLQLPAEFFARREVGDIVSRFGSIDSVRVALGQDLVAVIADGLFSLFMLFALCLYHPGLASIVIIFLLLTSAISLAGVVKEQGRRQEVLEAGAKQQSGFLESLENMEAIRNYGLQHQVFAKWRGRLVSSINANTSLQMLQLGLATWRGLLQSAEYLVLVVTGSMLIQEGDMSLGQLMAFILLRQHFTATVAAMLPRLAELRLLRVELARAADIVLQAATPAADCGLVPRPVLQNRLAVQDVGFSYPGQATSVFGKVSFSLPRGASLAITGKSGVGKTTLLRLLTAQLPLQSGSILIDKTPIEVLGHGRLVADVSIIMHRDTLFEGTIASNVCPDVSELDFDRLKRAGTLAGLGQSVAHLPLGWETPVGRRGEGFSAGQVKRILLARAVYRGPSLLVADEVFNAIDDSQAAKILQGLKQAGITVIFTTHNQFLARQASKEIELNP